ncbi:hypothetical protein EV421DRAFT_1917177 [Armillaria borealis]|uniref:Uncharacterized protein n=1 Tax=Armillaria borealis TaxID=47425 RepID=A0AA39IBT3_9AGAR|nr:hypothetical protein EV421DRAFT_1917177 [Armillaria borealis]
MANDYAYLIINDGSLYPISMWMLPTIVLLTYTSASVAQAFFCYRYWTIARNRWITGWITILITAHASRLLDLSVAMSDGNPDDLLPDIMHNFRHAPNGYRHYNSVYHVRSRLYSLSEAWLTGTSASSTICAVTDLTIAGFLAWTLLRIQSPNAVTRNILRRVTVHALTCGFTTAFSTTLMSIFMFTAWNAFYTIFTILGRIYSLTILFNLILLKVTSQGDQAHADNCSEPAILSPIYFKHNVDTTSTERRSSSSGSETVRYPTHPRSRHQANDRCFIHTV